MANKIEHVFVYGTLRPPSPNTPREDSRYYAQIESYVQTVTPAHLPQATLFNLGTYPAAISGQGTVWGDLLAVHPQAINIMDRIEGHPNFYKRTKVVVLTENGATQAWVYWAPKGLTRGRSCIENGDWLLRDDVPPEQITQLNQNYPLDVNSTLYKLVQRFAQSECVWFSSVRPNGKAHAVPVWHVWHQGKAYVVVSATSVKAVNIQQNPTVVLAHQDPKNPVIIEGWGTVVSSMRSQLQPIFYAKYGWDILTDSEYNTGIEITPLKLMSWGNYGEGRWLGEDVLRVWSV